MNRQISRVALVVAPAARVADRRDDVLADLGLGRPRGAAGQRDPARRAVRDQPRHDLRRRTARPCSPTNVRKKVGGQTLYFRTYPTHGFASQAIGYSTQSRSRAGLEREENTYLTASNKNLGTILDKLGDRLKGATIKGNDLVLNLKPGRSGSPSSCSRGKCGAAVVLNPKTGAVYVMASSPTYDPNLIEKPTATRRSRRRRRRARRRPRRSSTAPRRASTRRARRSRRHRRGRARRRHLHARLDLLRPRLLHRVRQAGLQRARPDGPEASATSTSSRRSSTRSTRSSATSARSSAPRAMLEQAKKFGFYSVPPLETPSDARRASRALPRTASCSTRGPREPQVDPGRLAFGQEPMLATPLQMAMVAAAVANDGRRDEADAREEGAVAGRRRSSRSLHPHELRQATKPATAADAEGHDGQGGRRAAPARTAQIPGVIVAGKTGTAETGTPGVYDAWFIFFAPAENPVLAGAVVVESQRNGFGGAVAAPIAKAAHAGDPAAASNASSRPERAS